MQKEWLHVLKFLQPLCKLLKRLEGLILQSKKDAEFREGWWKNVCLKVKVGCNKENNSETDLKKVPTCLLSKKNYHHFQY